LSHGQRLDAPALAEMKRRLLWHGLVVLLFGLLTGTIIPYFANPRLGLSAHLGGVQNGMLLLLLGLCWTEFRLAPGRARAAFGLILYSMYALFAGLFTAAMLGTRRTTPLAGAGFTAAAWKETLVAILLFSGSGAVVIACAVALSGLKRDGTESTGTPLGGSEGTPLVRR
jgi:hydroxylaminobenzene mutase